jgi:mRNA interferase MazF
MARSARVLRSATSSLNTAYCPDSGELIWIDFDPQSGREQAGRRPALVLSPRLYNQRSRLCVLCPITSQAKGYPFEVQVEAGGINGVVLSDQVKSLSWEPRRSEFICEAPDAALVHTRAKIKALIGIA